MHHQAPQESAKLREILLVQLDNFIIGAVIVVVVKLFARRDLVVNAVETNGHRDDHGCDGQRIQKRGQERRREREHQRQNNLRTHAQQDLGEDVQQHFPQEIDARHHEHQQHDDFKILFGFVNDAFRRRQPQQNCLDSQKTARLQRVAFQRHGQRENELRHQGPASHMWIDNHNERVQNEESKNGDFVPVRRISEEV